GFLADMRGWFGETFGDIANSINALTGPMTVVLGFIPILQGLQKVTWLTNLANKAWAFSTDLVSGAFKVLSTTIMSIPVFGWILAAVAAVAAGIYYAYENFEGFRKVILGTWEVVTGFFTDVGAWLGWN